MCHRCDWCQQPITPKVYTVIMPAGKQALVGVCCVHAAAKSMTNSPTPQISARGRELLQILEVDHG